MQHGSDMVGSALVELAEARKATVIATTGHTNAGFLSSLWPSRLPTSARYPWSSRPIALQRYRPQLGNDAQPLSLTYLSPVFAK